MPRAFKRETTIRRRFPQRKIIVLGDKSIYRIWKAVKLGRTSQRRFQFQESFVEKSLTRRFLERGGGEVAKS